MKYSFLLRMVLIAFALCLLASESAPAGVMVISVDNASTAPTLDSSFGTFEEALNLGRTGGGTTVRDSITFQNVAVTGATPQIQDNAPFTISVASSSGNVLQADVNGGDPLFTTELFGEDPLTLSILGLTPSLNYQFQFLHGDERSNAFYNGNVTFTDSNSLTDTVALTFGNAGPFPTSTSLALITVEVSNSTSLEYEMPKAGRGASFAGVVIHSTTVVPEPSSFALVGMAGLGLIVYRRRRESK